MHLVVFEDAHWPKLAPLNINRPACELLCGGRTLLQRMVRHLQPTTLSLWVRPELAESQRRRLQRDGINARVNTPLPDDRCLMLNARALLLEQVASLRSSPGGRTKDGSLIWCWLETMGAPAAGLLNTPAWQEVVDRQPIDGAVPLIDHAWDLLFPSEVAIRDDATHPPFARAPLPAGPFHVIEPAAIHFGEGVTIEPGAVLDASRGPILLGPGVIVGANAVIRGPVSIGQGTQIAPLSYLRPGVCVGADCRLGGELSACVMHSYSNKGHYGFLGDSVIGEWVNFGAGTTTSNLKNTYDNVSIPLAGKPTPTGRLLAGAIVGDHSKTGINCRLTTGSYIGYCCSLAGSAIAPQFVPSFSWVSDRGTEPYRQEKAIAVMRAVHSRRGREFTADDEADVPRFAELARVAEY